MAESSFAIPDRIKLPDGLLCRIIEIATMIMATVMIGDNRITTILLQVCTACCADWMQDHLSPDRLPIDVIIFMEQKTERSKYVDRC